MTTSHDVPNSSAITPVRPKRRRWGLYALGFLALGMIALGTAMTQGFHTAGTAMCTVIAVLGAAYCSIRGWRAMLGVDWLRAARRR